MYLACRPRKQGSYMVVYSIFMTIIALGVVVGFSFLVSSSPTGNELLYLSTGAPTIVLIMTALVVVPMQNATARVAGYIDFIKSLPVSRKYFLFADVTIWCHHHSAGDCCVCSGRTFHVPSRFFNLLDNSPRISIGGSLMFWHRIWLLICNAFRVGDGFIAGHCICSPHVLTDQLPNRTASRVAADCSHSFSPVSYGSSYARLLGSRYLPGAHS